MANPRGRIVDTNRPLTHGQVTLSGVKPRIIAYVKTDSRNMRDDFEKAVRHLGLDVILLQDFGFNAAFDVSGVPDALEEFTKRRCVLRWHYALDCKLPMRGMGAGEKPERQPHPLTQRLIASVRARSANDASAAEAKAVVPTLERHAAIGI